MVLARQQVAEQLERVGLGALRQFIRPPGLANQARGTVTIAFGEQHPREREAAVGAHRPIADETANGGGVAALLPQARLGPLPHQPHARPARVIGDERRVSAEVRVGLRMAQDEPFDEFPRRRVADCLLLWRSPRLSWPCARDRSHSLQPRDRPIAERRRRPEAARRWTASICVVPPRHALHARLSSAPRWRWCRTPVASCGFLAC